MQCRHPITNEWCELTNREWRCIKLAIPLDTDIWGLLCAEQDYEYLITVVSERRHDAATMQWLIRQLIAHPKNVLSSPGMLHAWYMHITAFYDVSTITQQLAHQARLQAKLAKLQASKQAVAMRMAKQIQRQIKQMKEARVRKIRAKRRGR